MNIYTFAIAQLLKVSDELALRIQKEMEMTSFDFSESSDSQLKREAKLTLRMMEAK